MYQVHFIEIISCPLQTFCVSYSCLWKGSQKISIMAYIKNEITLFVQCFSWRKKIQRSLKTLLADLLWPQVLYCSPKLSRRLCEQICVSLGLLSRQLPSSKSYSMYQENVEIVICASLFIHQRFKSCFSGH